jgi:hypothetical protein
MALTVRELPSSMGERYMPEYYPGGGQAGRTSPG